MSKTYVPGDFSFWNSAYDEAMYKNAYDAITTENLWDWMKTASPPENKGFMFWDAPELKRLNKHMDVMGHSGFSYGMTLRTMEAIAKKGWDTYVKDTIEAIDRYQREKAEKEAEKNHQQEAIKKQYVSNNRSYWF